MTSTGLYNVWTVAGILVCLSTASSRVLVEHPKSATVAQGGNISLECKFNESISKCVWYRNGSSVNIKDRYKYIDVKDNGTNTVNCSIEITGIGRIDATYWQCSCVADSNYTYDNCMSNSAYVTLNDSSKPSAETSSNQQTMNRTPTTLLTPTISPHIHTNDSSVSENPLLSLTNLLLIVVIGLILFTIGLLAAVYCHRKTKARRMQNSKLQIATTNLPNIVVPLDSPPNLNRSTESICTLCHQHKPEACSPGSVWSTPYPHHSMDHCLALPEVDKNLPSYDEANLRPYDQTYEQMPNRESMNGYMTVDDVKKETLTTSTECNPLYEQPIDSHMTVDDVEKETTAANNWSSQCQPLYEEVPVENPEVLGESLEIVHFQAGYQDAVYTRIDPKRRAT